MIEEASRVGANAVKLQTANADKSYLKTSPSYQIFKDSQLSKEDTAKMFEYAKDLKIDIFTTVTDEETANWVKKLKPCAWKISSGLLNHTPLISHLCLYNEPIYLSTGMALLDDIDVAVDIIKSKKKTCTLFQCTSEYPLKDENVNLGAIQFFRDRYELEVGYSDHSTESNICNLAVAAGAKKIEKHFTFDKSRSGYDHSISADSNDFQDLVSEIKKTQKIFGNYEKTKSEAIILARKTFLRYLVASKDLEKNSILSLSDFEIKRVTPGDSGIEPNEMKKMIGCKLKNSIAKHQVFKKDDILLLN
jgi:sialic acid synthase SpsE